MELTLWLSYVAMISALIAFPGPSSLLITMHGYRYGLKRSNYTIIANLLGSLVLMVLSALGLGILIATSDNLFSIVKYLGAAYLVYMGVKTWRKSTLPATKNSSNNINGESVSSMFKQGFFTGISNPKDLVFFAALFPVFINSEQPIIGQFLILMLTWLAIDYIIKIIYSLTGKRINKEFSSNSFVTIFNRITGGMFIVAGLALAGSNHK
jgi:threonine/homoserine/homoserine lactone efflux protein